MKILRYIKLSLLLAVILFSANVASQNKESVVHWSSPAAFIPSDEVEFYFDLTDTKLEGESSIFIHTWFPSDQTADNRDESELELTHIKDNIWKFVMTPTDFYQRTSEQLYESGQFYGMLRNGDWSKADVYFTPDIEASSIIIPDLDYIKGDGIISVYPEKFTANKPVSILINSKNTWSNNTTGDCVKGELNNSSQVVAHSGVNSWEVVVPSDLPQSKLTNIGDGVWRLDMIINDYYSLSEEDELEGIDLVFASSDWTWQGFDAGCNDFRILAPDVPVPPPANLYFFPMKISKNDILVITRDNNNKGQKLSYEITGGSTVIEGELEGGMSRQRAFINIGKEFGKESLSKIDVVIKDQNEKVIYQGEMPLLKVDNLK